MRPQGLATAKTVAKAEWSANRRGRWSRDPDAMTDIPAALMDVLVPPQPVRRHEHMADRGYQAAVTAELRCLAQIQTT